jgi:hypothetical protein
MDWIDGETPGTANHTPPTWPTANPAAPQPARRSSGKQRVLTPLISPRQLKSFQGSKFPSHKLWFDHIVQAENPQSSFSALWNPSTDDATFVA